MTCFARGSLRLMRPGSGPVSWLWARLMVLGLTRPSQASLVPGSRPCQPAAGAIERMQMATSGDFLSSK